VYDQANDLRQLVRRDDRLTVAAPRSRPKFVAITGGKGGVGTTTVAVNLAVELARHSQRILLVDADPDGGDAATLCRLQERYNLADVLRAYRTVHDVLQPGPGGIQVLPGVWGRADVAECSAAAQERLIDQLEGLGGRFELVLVDTGNGLNRMVRRFWQTADAVLLVTTSETTAVMDAYASIKVLAAGDDAMPIRSLVNMAPDSNTADDVHCRLTRVCLRFLGIHLDRAGEVEADPQVVVCSKAGEPFVIAAPGCKAARRIRSLAKTMIDKPILSKMESPEPLTA